MSQAAPGLRERKNARTRTAIVRATLELTLERGFEGATIAQIAERADVAPRTVHTWFASKEEIVLGGVAEPLERLRDALVDGAGDTVDRIERWMADEGERFAAEDEIGRLRLRALTVDLRLRALERTKLDSIEEAIAAAVRRDVGLPSDHVAARMFAAATTALLIGLRQMYVDGATDGPAAREDAFRMLHGALGALSPRS